MMTKSDAEAIVGVVASDPEAAKRIESNIDEVIPASWGISGGLRNAGYVALNILSLGKTGDPTDKEFADRVCTGIADATVDAITKAIKAKDARLRRVARASVVDRKNLGTAHTATSITMIDGHTHVFDWHATLDEDNPMLYRRVHEWSNNAGGVPYLDFDGWD